MQIQNYLKQHLNQAVLELRNAEDSFEQDVETQMQIQYLYRHLLEIANGIKLGFAFVEVVKLTIRNFQMRGIKSSKYLDALMAELGESRKISPGR